MQVTEVANEGLKRAFSVVVPATDITAEREKRLAQLGKDLRLPGSAPARSRRGWCSSATAKR
jgi:trigger factor